MAMVKLTARKAAKRARDILLEELAWIAVDPKDAELIERIELSLKEIAALERKH